MTTTTRSNWTAAALLIEGNPCDGYTLFRTLGTVGSVTGVAATDAYLIKAIAAAVIPAAPRSKSPEKHVTHGVKVPPSMHRYRAEDRAS